MAENKLKYFITADHTKFEKGMKKVSSLAKSTGKAVGVGMVAGSAVALAGIFALNKVMSEAVELANVQEEAEAKLGAVLKATGEAAGFNLQQMTAMAGAMQGVTTVGDETIIAGQAILATFKEIRGEGFERATMAALDMSAVMGTDLTGSMVQVGKAINDPIKGLSALSRVGVSFTEQQKEQIKALQESGDMMGAQSIILSELESQFGGAAAALRDTYGGAVIAAKNAFGDLQEQIGFTITKNQTFVNLAIKAEETFIRWTEVIKANETQIASLAEASLESITSIIEATAAGIGFMGKSVQGWDAIIAKVTGDSVAYAEAVAKINGEVFGLKETFVVLQKEQSKLKQQLQETGKLGLGYDSLKEKLDAVNVQIRETLIALDNQPPTIEKVTDAHKDSADAIIESNEEVKNKEVENQKAIEEARTKAFEQNQKESDALITKLNAVQDAKEIETDFWLLKDQDKAKSVEDTGDKIRDESKDTTDILKGHIGTVTAAFVAGEDIKQTVAKLATTYLTGLGEEWASKGLDAILGRHGEEIGANVALGTAQTGTFGDTWQEKLGTGAAYLAAAGAAVLAGKFVGDSLYAQGGWLGSNPNGGMINAGAGGVDDVFLGATDNGMTRNWGARNEFVMDAETTKHNYGLLEYMRGKKKKVFAEGGPITDAWEPTRDINDSGFDTFWKSVLESNGNWKKAIAESVAYYAGTGGGMIAGKLIGKNLFAGGGVVRDRGFGFGGLTDLLDPGGVFHDTGDSTISKLLDPLGINDKLTGLNFGEVWAQMRKLPVVGETVERADKILYPFVRDTLTPGKFPNFTTAEDMLSGMFEGLTGELATWLAYSGLDPIGGALGIGSLFKDGGVIGSFETGTDYVRKTGPYMLHQGESVDSVPDKNKTIELLTEIKELLQSSLYSIARDTADLLIIQNKFDVKGMAVRT